MLSLLAAAGIAGACTDTTVDLRDGPGPTGTNTPLPPECLVSGNLCALGQPELGDGGPALQANFAVPRGFAIAPDGALWIADTLHDRVRRINASATQVDTRIGDGSQQNPELDAHAHETGADGASMIAVCEDGWVYWSSENEGQIFSVDPATNRIADPLGDDSGGMPVDGPVENGRFLLEIHSQLLCDGDALYVSDSANQVVQLVNRSETATLVRHGKTLPPRHVATIAGGGATAPDVAGIPGTSASLQRPAGLARAGGTLYLADVYADRVFALDDAGTIRHFAGSGGNCDLENELPPTSIGLCGPFGLATDGEVLAIHGFNVIHAMQLDTSASPVNAFGVELDTNEVQRIAGSAVAGPAFADGGSALDLLSDVTNTSGLGFDSEGNLLFLDNYNGLVRAVSRADGRVVTIAGLSYATRLDEFLNQPLSVAVATDGMLVVTGFSSYVWSVDPVTGATTPLHGGPSIEGTGFLSGLLSLNGAGTLAFADLYHCDVVVLPPAGPEERLYVDTCEVGGVAIDAAGNVFYEDDHRIFFWNRGATEVTVAGVTVAPGTQARIAGTGVQDYFGDGGPALDANLYFGCFLPRMAVSPSSLVVADCGNYRLRAIDLATGTIDTVAGDGGGNPSDADGPALATSIGLVDGLAVAGGWVYWYEERDARVRRAPIDGGMTETLAGGSGPGWSGGGGPALDASIWVNGIAVAPDGVVYLAGEHRIFRIQP